MCRRIWQDGKFLEIDEPQELADRVLQTLRFYQEEADEAREKAAKTREEVAADIVNEYADENMRLKNELSFAIASVSSEKELNDYTIFQCEHLACRNTKATGGMMPIIQQIGTGIGVCTYLECPVCHEKKDITDTSVW